MGTNNTLIKTYLNKQDWKVKENSNMCFSLQGLNNYIASRSSADYWLECIYPKQISEAHKQGHIHIHDLSLLAVYCVGWDLQHLLRKGFKGVKGKVESDPPNHLHSALGQIVNFFYTLQGEAAGAQALSNFDTLLAPFIKHDNLDYKDVKQAIQEFVFNINIPTRVGFQTPFTNITMDLYVPDIFKDQPVIIGGKERNNTYSEFQYEMNLINRAFGEVMLEGDAKGRIFTFPIPTYNITKDFGWDNAELNNLWEMTGKYGIPYFANFVNSDMSPDDARSMCCRLRLDKRELTKRGGGLFGSNPLTGSIGVVTVNLPSIGYQSKNYQQFLDILQKRITLATKSLIIKRKVIEQFTEQNLYPYAKYYLKSIKQASGNYWTNHFSTIGIIGMNEAIMNYMGKEENIGSKKGLEFSLEVMNYIRCLISGLQEETGDLFNLEATPAEGTSYRLAKLDKETYPDIICAGYDIPYYTNSTSLPVNYTDDLFKALELQDKLQTKYTGGTVFHVYAGERIRDMEIIKSLVKKISSNFHLPYFTITPTFSICPKHGYTTGEVKICQKCGSKNEVYSRVVGYLRPVNQWNRGKREEFKARKSLMNIQKNS